MDNNIPHHPSVSERLLAFFWSSSTDGFSMMQAANSTGIGKDVISYVVDNLRNDGMLFPCGKRIDPLTNASVEYLTSNPRVSLQHYIHLCLPILINQKTETQFILMEAIKAYAVEQRQEIHTFRLETIEALLIWENQVKPLINKDNGI